MSIGNDPPLTPGGQPARTIPPVIPTQLTASLDFTQVQTALSQFGASLYGSSFTLSSVSSGQQSPQIVNKLGGVQPMDAVSSSATNAPSWLAVGITVTSLVNFVQFDAGFTDGSSAQGLLTVYWNTNQIGSVDERVASYGLQTYRLLLPQTLATGLYTLSFRLDAFNNTSSSITVTNVVTGFSGITQATTLGITRDITGAPFLQLTGASNCTYLVQCSSNLVDWVPMALVVTTNNTMFFPDPDWTNYKARFYRALIPQ